MKRMRLSGGQALVELVFVSVVWGLLLLGLIAYSRFGLLRQRALVGARLGAILASSGLVQDQDIENELKHYFSKITGNSSIKWNWLYKRFEDTPASRFYNLIVAQVNARIYFHHAGGLPIPPLDISEKVVIQEAPEL